MKTLLTLASLLLFTFAHEQKLEITQLTGNCYIFVTYGDPGDGSAYPANGMYLLTDAGAVLFDTPWDTTQCQPLLDSIKRRHGKDVIMSISTHFHEDRTGGINYYKSKGIRTYSTTYTQQLCKENKEPVAEYSFKGDTTFSIGGYTFEIFYPGKGHAPDNIIAYLPQDKVLYGGCFVKSADSRSLGNLSHADPAAWKNSIERTMKRYPSPIHVVPGHGDWQSNKGLQQTMKLLKEYKK